MSQDDAASPASTYGEPERQLSADPEDLKKGFNLRASSFPDILHFSGNQVHSDQSNGFYGVMGPIALPSRPEIGATHGTEACALFNQGTG